MKRLVARFEDGEDANAAEAALRDEGLEHDRAAIENPIFDPTASLPEVRGLAWGALIGGVVGLLVFQALNADIVWVPRWSPMMSAGEYAVPFLGLGLGVAIGGFVGGVIGTMRPVPDPDGADVVVDAPDHRVNEAAGLLRDRGASVVEGTVTYHENPEKRHDRSGESRRSSL